MSRAVTEIAAPKDLSPADAKAKLDQMILDYRGAPKPAATKLAGMLADQDSLRSIEHGGVHGQSDGTALPGGVAFDGLQKAIADHQVERGDPVSRAMVGELDAINESGYLQTKKTVDALRADGIGDDAIRQYISGESVSREEYARVTRWKATALEDPVYVAAYLKGNPTAVRAMTNAMIVLTSPIKEDAA
jgi:hypothetical protein